MKEKNLYTITLAAVGMLSLVLAAYALITSDHRWELMWKLGLASVLVLFPIRIPLKFDYSFDQVAIVYVTLAADWRLAGLVVLISMLCVYLRFGWEKYSPFRLAINIGMGHLAIIPLAIPYFTNHSMNYWDVLALFILMDITSLSINRSIHISILGWSVLQFPQFSTAKYPVLFSFFSSVIGYRIIGVDSITALAIEIGYLGIMLFVFSYLSSIALNHHREAEDTRKRIELGFTSIGRFVLELSRQGHIQSSNTIGLHVLGLSQLDSATQPSIEAFIHADSIEEFRRVYQLVLDGQTQEATLQIGAPNLLSTSPPYHIHLIPCVRNMKLEGVMMIGSEASSSGLLTLSRV